MYLVGCEKKIEQNDDASAVAAEIPDDLTVLLVGEPVLGSRIKRQWSARRDGTLSIKNQTVAEFEATEFLIADDVDIVIYPPTMIGELVSRGSLREMTGDFLDSDELNRRELLRHFRTTVVRQRSETWAVPLGGASFSLMYNRKAFKELSPLEHWGDLESTLAKLSETEFVTNNKIESKIDMPLGQGWAAHTFLACVAPSVCNRGKLSTLLNRSTMEPLITSPPFVETLDKITATASSFSLKSDPTLVFQRALAGESAISMGWPARGFENQTEDGGDMSEQSSARKPRQFDFAFIARCPEVV